MKINSKIRYGLRTVIEIALCNDPNGILQKEIAKNQNLSYKYLDSIISSLKLKGIIVNSKGKGSGYKLNIEPEKITMLDIYTAFEQIIVVDCINSKDSCERANADCKARCYWYQLKNQFIQLLSRKSLADILNSTDEKCVDFEF